MGIDLSSTASDVVGLIVVAAFFTSALTAMVGAGGGTALLLLMLYLMPAGQVVPVHGGIQLAANMTRVVLFWRHMQWPIIWRFVVPMPAGVYLGLQLYDMLSAAALQLVIAGFVLLSLLLRVPETAQPSGPPGWVYIVTGFFIGVGNMIVGVLAPVLGALLRLENMPKERLVGTLGFFGLAGNLFKIAGFALVGFAFAPHALTIACAALATVAGTYVGKRLLARLSSRLFTTLFQIMLAALAVRLIWQAMPVFLTS